MGITTSHLAHKIYQTCQKVAIPNVMKQSRDSYASVGSWASYFTDNSYQCLLKIIQRHDMNVHIFWNF